MEVLSVKPVAFLKNVSREMKKVSWPKGRELTRYTITVVLTVAFVTVFFAVVDLGITQLLNLLFE
nr:preprotein translocase subunit SecE [Gracilibacillus alcaliphilus]